MSTGWTLAHVGDTVDLPTLGRLNKYWAKHPPMHVLLAAHVGYKPPGERRSAKSGEHYARDDDGREMSFEQAMAMFPVTPGGFPDYSKYETQ